METERFSGHVTNYQNAEFSVLFSLNALNIKQNVILTLGIPPGNLIFIFANIDRRSYRCNIYQHPGLLHTITSAAAILWQLL